MKAEKVSHVWRGLWLCRCPEIRWRVGLVPRRRCRGGRLSSVERSLDCKFAFRGVLGYSQGGGLRQRGSPAGRTEPRLLVLSAGGDGSGPLSSMSGDVRGTLAPTGAGMPVWGPAGVLESDGLGRIYWFSGFCVAGLLWCGYTFWGCIFGPCVCVAGRRNGIEVYCFLPDCWVVVVSPTRAHKCSNVYGYDVRRDWG